MAKFTVRLEGFDEVKARLGLFPERLRKNILRGAIRAGAAEFRKGIKARTPKKRGDLFRSVRVSMKVYRPDRPRADIKVGARRKERKDGRVEDTFYAHMVEGGVRAHSLQPKNRKALTIKNAAGVTVAVRRSAQHPGFRGVGMVRRAREQDADKAITAFQKYAQLRSRQFFQTGQTDAG